MKDKVVSLTLNFEGEIRSQILNNGLKKRHAYTWHSKEALL